MARLILSRDSDFGDGTVQNGWSLTSTLRAKGNGPLFEKPGTGWIDGIITLVTWKRWKLQWPRVTAELSFNPNTSQSMPATGIESRSTRTTTLWITELLAFSVRGVIRKPGGCTCLSFTFLCAMLMLIRGTSDRTEPTPTPSLSWKQSTMKSILNRRLRTWAKSTVLKSSREHSGY